MIRLLTATCVHADTRVLDLGCAVGGASFALSRTFGRVVGLDYSQAFVDAANALKARARAHAT